MKDLCRLWVMLHSAPQGNMISRVWSACPYHICALVLIVICKLDLNHMLPPHSHALILLQLVCQGYLLRHLQNMKTPFSAKGSEVLQTAECIMLVYLAGHCLAHSSHATNE